MLNSRFDFSPFENILDVVLLGEESVVEVVPVESVAVVVDVESVVEVVVSLAVIPSETTPSIRLIKFPYSLWVAF